MHKVLVDQNKWAPIISFIVHFYMIDCLHHFTLTITLSHLLSNVSQIDQYTNQYLTEDISSIPSLISYYLKTNLTSPFSLTTS